MFWNAAKMMGVGFSNIPFFAKAGLNEFLSLIEKTVNSAIELLNKIPSVSIGKVSIGKLDIGGFKEMTTGITD